MKFVILSLMMSFSLFASTENSDFYPGGTKLPKKRFLEIIKVFEAEMGPLAAKDHRIFEILSDYNEDWAQAFARRWETDHIIVYGGASAIRNGTEDTFALLLCHESGHLYGGLPWGDDKNRLSLEGQADYWSAACFKKIAPKISGYSDERFIKAALTLTAFYADNRSLPHPEVTTPDANVVTQTLRTHPEPQCRFDTIMAGMKGSPRPKCWFAD